MGEADDNYVVVKCMLYSMLLSGMEKKERKVGGMEITEDNASLYRMVRGGLCDKAFFTGSEEGSHVDIWSSSTLGRGIHEHKTQGSITSYGFISHRIISSCHIFVY